MLFRSALFKVLYCKSQNVFFIFCVCLLCVICVKSIINLFQCSTREPTVLVVGPRLTLLDLRTNRTYYKSPEKSPGTRGPQDAACPFGRPG